MDNILDHVVVKGQRYDIVSPTAFGDYIETIGSACINPDGYAQGSTFLAKLGNEQFYYEATAAITQGSAILEGTNCKKTTVTGREAELASEIQTLDETVDSLNEAFTNYTENIDSVISANGAKNLLPNTAVSEVKNGVTFTVNADGTVTAIGTAGTDGAGISFNVSIPNGHYKLSGCPSGGGQFRYRIQAKSSNNSYHSDEGNGVIINNDIVTVFLVVAQGQAVNLVFKPMLTLADQPNSDYAHYVPYAMTNRELTETLIPSYGSISSFKNSNAVTYLSGGFVKLGKLVIISGVWEGSCSNSVPILTLPSELRPTIQQAGAGMILKSGTWYGSVYYLTANGYILQGATSAATDAGSFTIAYTL